jgi:hypothetical protein
MAIHFERQEKNAPDAFLAGCGFREHCLIVARSRYEKSQCDWDAINIVARAAR